jgi:hypothetical protein
VLHSIAATGKHSAETSSNVTGTVQCRQQLGRGSLPRCNQSTKVAIDRQSQKNLISITKNKIKDITIAMMWNQPFVAKRIDHIPRYKFENKNILFCFCYFKK